MPKRDFLAIPDLSNTELSQLFDLAGQMKSGKYRNRPLEGQTLAMVFAKSSTRTRVSFEVGAHQLGGQAVFLSARDIQLGRGEPIKDMARVLSRYVHGIMIRTFAQADVIELARYADVPVINGLTDLQHPCQVLADLMTVQECLGGWSGKSVAWIGDGNNMANSWMDAAGVLGFELRLACPEGLRAGSRTLRAEQQAHQHSHHRASGRSRRGSRRDHHRRLGLDGAGGRGASNEGVAFQAYTWMRS
jgi:ornithine carbamoyltransferase